jgi:hypothetical protein
LSFQIMQMKNKKGNTNVSKLEISNKQTICADI